MSTPTNRIVVSLQKLQVFNDLKGLIDDTVSFNQGDLLVWKSGLVQKASSEVDFMSAFLGVADCTVKNGIMVSPFTSAYGTTASRMPVGSSIPGPFYGVIAAMVLKSGDSLDPGDSVYGDPVSGPEFVSASGSYVIGVYQGPDSVTGDGKLTVDCLLQSNKFSSSGGGGGGDVTGPSSSDDNALAVFSGSTGKVIKQNSATAVLTTAGNLGLGNTSPTNNRISAYKSWDGSGSWSNIDGSLVVTAAGAGGDGFFQQGIYIDVRADHDTGTLDLMRNYLTAEMSGDGNVTEMYGIRAISRVFDYNAGGGDTSAGIVQKAFGMEAYVGNVATGGAVIREAYGIYISRAQAIGTDAGQTHTAIGLWIGNTITASGGDTNNTYAIKSDSTALSLFEGTVRAQQFIPNQNFVSNLGAFSTPFGAAYVGGVAFVSGQQLLFEPNSPSESYTTRWPNSRGDVGQALVIDTTGGVAVNLEYRSVADVAIATPGAQPAASSGLRGKLWLTEGGAGVADVLEICIKDATDTYVWMNVDLS